MVDKRIKGQRNIMIGIVLLLLSVVFASGLITSFTSTATLNTTVFDRTTPNVTLITPANDSGVVFGEIKFHFNVSDQQWANISSCSLIINDTVNATLFNLTYSNGSNAFLSNITQNFTIASIAVGDYSWYVNCSEYRDPAFNDTNVTQIGSSEVRVLESAVYVAKPVEINISVVNENTTLNWAPISDATSYKIYSSSTASGTYSLLNQTTILNFTDTNASSFTQRYYKVAAVNALGENLSTKILGKVTYTLRQKVGANTRNWISFPVNDSSLQRASDLLNTINNVTSIVRWNASNQSSQTCNQASCPNDACTATNCNFDIEAGQMYEVNINSSAPIAVNWTMSGTLKAPANVSIVYLDGTTSRNFVPIAPNSTFTKAQDVIDDIGVVSVFRKWDALNQKTVFRFSFFNRFFGQNFDVYTYDGYDVVPTENVTWAQR